MVNFRKSQEIESTELLQSDLFSPTNTLLLTAPSPLPSLSPQLPIAVHHVDEHVASLSESKPLILRNRRRTDDTE